jgi:biotin synthase
MIRLSIGSAAVLGLKIMRTDSPSTTAYIMGGNGRCLNNCRFCSQAREATCGDDMLSRVKWPSFDLDQVLPLLESAFQKGKIKRACIQMVFNKGSFEMSLDILKGLSETSLPISVSTNVKDQAQAERLFLAGASRVCIAMDAATERVHREIKRDDYHRKMELLESCARTFPGRMSTHLIVGLGETEEEMLRTIARMHRMDITVGLFAFTPIRGTAMENVDPPPIGSYRRVQLGNWLIREGFGLDRMVFSCGRLIGLTMDLKSLENRIKSGEPFRTAGCEGCNRPYYNETPGRGPMYNYARPLVESEARTALEETEISALLKRED